MQKKLTCAAFRFFNLNTYTLNTTYPFHDISHDAKTSIHRQINTVKANTKRCFIKKACKQSFF